MQPTHDNESNIISIIFESSRLALYPTQIVRQTASAAVTSIQTKYSNCNREWSELIERSLPLTRERIHFLILEWILHRSFTTVHGKTPNVPPSRRLPWQGNSATAAMEIEIAPALSTIGTDQCQARDIDTFESTNDMNIDAAPIPIVQPRTFFLHDEVVLDDGRLLRKADLTKRRDCKYVDKEGYTVMTLRYLKQLCGEQKGYNTPSLNDKLYLHFKGSSPSNFYIASSTTLSALAYIFYLPALHFTFHWLSKVSATSIITPTRLWKDRIVGWVHGLEVAVAWRERSESHWESPSYDRPEMLVINFSFD